MKKFKNIKSFDKFLKLIKEGRGNTIIRLNGERIPMYYIDNDNIYGVDYKLTIKIDEDIYPIEDRHELSDELESISELSDINDYFPTYFFYGEESELEEAKEKIENANLDYIDTVKVERSYDSFDDGTYYDDFKSTLQEAISNIGFNSETYLEEDYEVIGENDKYKFIVFDNEWSVGVGITCDETSDVDTDYIQFSADTEEEFNTKKTALMNILNNANAVLDDDNLVEYYELDEEFDIVFKSELSSEVIEELKNHEYVDEYGSYGTMTIENEIDQEFAKKVFIEVNKFYPLVPYGGAWTSGTKIPVGELK